MRRRLQHKTDFEVETFSVGILLEDRSRNLYAP